MFYSTRFFLAKSGGGLDIQVVTAGLVGVAPDRSRGFISGGFGSIADGTSNIYGGAAILELYHNETTGLVNFKVTGTVANSGWTTLSVDGAAAVTLSRTAATYSNPSGNSLWAWTTGNPFGTTGAVRNVTFN